MARTSKAAENKAVVYVCGGGADERKKTSCIIFWYERHTSLVARRENKTQFGYVISWLMRRKTLPCHIMLAVFVNSMLFHILSSLNCRTFHASMNAS